MSKQMTLSEAIRELRSVMGLSQTKFGFAMNDTSLPTVQRWEAGSFIPKPGSLAKLYRLARKAKRDDLAEIFIRGGHGAPQGKTLPEWQQRIPEAVELYAGVHADLTQALDDPTLSPEAKNKLLGKSVAVGVEVMKLLSWIAQESQA